jgi:hypothetical protein
MMYQNSSYKKSTNLVKIQQRRDDWKKFKQTYEKFTMGKHDS